MRNNLLKAGILAAIIILLILGISIAASKKTNDSKNKVVKASQKAEGNKPLNEKEREEYLLKTNFIEKNGEIPFNVYSDGAVVFDSESGEILYQKLPDMKLPTASISKIMTAIIVFENAKLDKEIKISGNAAGQIPNSMDLREGEILKVSELLHGLMKLSANDSAFALAEGTIGLDNFVSAMNKKAEWLELKNTKFTNPAGFDDPEHKSTAHDLAVITRYALKKHPNILEFMGKDDVSIEKNEKHDAHFIYHISGLLKSYEGLDGAKTGYTWEAGHTFIGTAEREGKRIGVVILNSHNSGGDITGLLDYGFRSVNKL